MMEKFDLDQWLHESMRFYQHNNSDLKREFKSCLTKGYNKAREVLLAEVMREIEAHEKENAEVMLSTEVIKQIITKMQGEK